ncbi:hypothetical protein ABZ568_06305 [Streptomyces olindensis]|uniref:Uncharacterized protein n=1 Tax=Streptomyces olindensis TaxID=358823 RepID=A0ABV2XPW4_9ACTN
MTDVLRRQKTEALAAELADRAAVLVRWADQEGIDWAILSAVADGVGKVAEVFARYRPEDERTVEHEAVEVLREFLGSFPEPSQKRMLYTLLAAGMDSAQRPRHAAKAQALLNGHTVVDPAGGS